ncbi:zinc ABC transporter substrate-binding protein [Arenibaculum pallidiluteum]|uniref:zinc ABC transporter substrate-binding protein n=1 Tax=Arenibaculum pallidiluteum TaxID=2812559 RepID=UPI001A96F8FB|nr:zinc ABC transporter substrate-binding protein [Arenibaculum pallidiluteum]
MLSRFLALPAATCAALAFLAGGPALAAAPHVVVSVKPIHSLVAGVMEGVGTPDLLVKGAASPHTYALKPSDAASLRRARLIFWVGEDLETFLEKALATLGGGAEAVALSEQPGIRTLPLREGGLWAGHDDHNHGHAHGQDHDDHGDHGDHGHDGHLWLDAGNARAIVEIAADRLAAADPANAAAYRSNAERVSARLDTLDAELRDMLAPVKDRPFVVFHDAYRYFEERYGLRAVGSITVSPERAPSARRLREIRDTLRGRGAVCVFAEPQFEPALVGTVVEGTGVKRGVLDPEGAVLPDGPDLYFALMRGNARALAECLG